MEGTEAATSDTESVLSAAALWREHLSQRHTAWHVFKAELQRVSTEVCTLHGQLMVGVDSRPFGEFVGDLSALQAQLEVRKGKFGEGRIGVLACVREEVEMDVLCKWQLINLTTWREWIGIVIANTLPLETSLADRIGANVVVQTGYGEVRTGDSKELM